MNDGVRKLTVDEGRWIRQQNATICYLCGGGHAAARCPNANKDASSRAARKAFKDRGLKEMRGPRRSASPVQGDAEAVAGGNMDNEQGDGLSRSDRLRMLNDTATKLVVSRGAECETQEHKTRQVIAR